MQNFLQAAAAKRAYSLHHPAHSALCSEVMLKNGNEFTVISGSMLDLKWFLHPIAPAQGILEVAERFDALPGQYNAFSLTLKPRNPNPNPVEVEIILSEKGEVLAKQTIVVGEAKRFHIDLVAKRHFTEPKIALRLKPANTNQVSRTGIEVHSALFYENDALTALANRAQSDKGSVFPVIASPHCYTMAYNALFQAMRDKPINILEIGLNVGAHDRNKIDALPSIDMWLEYFPHAKIDGIDIVETKHLTTPERVQLATADQSSPASLAEAMKTLGNKSYDVIIDDGSHAPSHQRISFENLAPNLASGGLYIIEDLGWQPWAERPTIPELFEMRNAQEFRKKYEAFYNLVNESSDNACLMRPNDSNIFVFASA